MTQVLDWRTASDPGDLLRQALHALGAGHVVVFPTETLYAAAASATLSEAVARLPGQEPPWVAVASSEDLLAWSPGAGELAQRLARRCWPGPVTLAVNAVPDALASQLPEPVRQRLCPDGIVRLRCPGHEVLLDLLEEASAPIALIDLPATTAEEAAAALGETAALVIDDGPCRYGKPDTVVRVDGDHWEILRAGLVDLALLRKQTTYLLVFVCTGNTCRSPLAEALCKKMLADRLGCAVGELESRGFHVLSAGVAAMMGGAAAAEAVTVAGDFGADLSGHQSQPLSPDLIATADSLVVMTEGHRRLVEEMFADLRPRVEMLDPAGQDISDPIGADLPVYRACAEQIQGHLGAWVERLASKASPAGDKS